MATYTDLGNRVRENVVVDYHTRETAQCVKLLNDNNEYHGVFKGISELSAVNVVGGELSGVTLRDVEFAGGVYLPGHTDITDLGKEIADVKNDTDTRCSEMETAVSRVEADFKSTKTELEDKIYYAKKDCEDQIQSNARLIKNVESRHASDVKMLKDDLSNLHAETIRMDNLNTLSAQLACQINTVLSNAETSTSKLDFNVCMVSAEARKAISASDKAASDVAKTNQNVADLSGVVGGLSVKTASNEKKYYNLTTDLDTEKTTRSSEDSSLCAAIRGVHSSLEISTQRLSSWLLSVANVAADTAAGANTWKQPLADVSTSLTHALEISVITLTAADAAAATRIAALEKDSEQHVAKADLIAANSGLTAQIFEASSTLSNALEDVSAALASGIADAKTEAFGKTDAAAEAAQQELFQVSTHISADMQVLAGRATQLETDVVQLNVDLAAENSKRAEEDQNLATKIEANAEKEAADIAYLDEALSRDISEVEQTAAEELAALAKKTTEDIWTGSHYKIVRDGQVQWPCKCEDFAVNVYADAGPDAVVKYVGSDNEVYSIGTVAPRKDGSYFFKAFSEIKPEIVAAAIEPKGEYVFPADGQPIATLLGCQLQYKPSADGLKGEIAAAPIAPKYCSLQCGGAQIGKIYDAAFDGAGNLLSGKITIQTADREFASFLSFYAKPFDMAELSSVQVDTEKIEYLGNNEFQLYAGIEERRRMQLVDAVVPGRRFGYLLSSAASNPVAYDEDGKIEKIVATVDTGDGEIEAELSRAGGFQTKLSSWTNIDGRGWQRFFEAEIDDETPANVCFSVVDRSVRKAMPIQSIDAAGILSGCLVPDAWNIENPLALDYGRVGKISAYVSAFVPVESIQKECYVLERKETGNGCGCECGGSNLETVFATSETDGNGNTVDLKFSGRAFHMVVTSADGKVLRYSYAFKSRDEWPDFEDEENGTVELAVNETEAKPLAFGAAFDDPKFSWLAKADSRELLDSREDFRMDVMEMDRQLQLVLPDGTPGRAREFIAMVQPSGDKPLKVVFVDKRGQNLDSQIILSRNYGAEATDEFTAPSGKWTAFKVQEILQGRFVVVDSLDVASKIANRLEELSVAIDSENARAVLAENGISGIVDTLSADLSVAIDKLSADLSNEISAEAGRATSAEAGISAAVDAVSNSVSELSGKHEAEVGRAIAAEETLATRATDLEARATATEQKLDDEIARALSGEEDIRAYAHEVEAKCGSETVRAEGVEQQISAGLSDLSASFGEVSADHEARVAKVEEEAEATFTKAEYVAGGRDVVTNLLKFVDKKDTTKTYMLLVEDGTLVLSAIEAAN